MKQLIFGITGPTGAGKSTVSQYFARMGVNVVDADALYHTLIKVGMPCTKELTSVFGDGILLPNGDIDRKKLGEIVFCDKDKLNTLNKITHKYIKAELIKAFGTSPVCAIDGAVIIGSDIEAMCDYMVAVVAGEQTRLNRIVKRDNISEDNARKRIASQKDNNFYIENADFVIENNGCTDLEKEACNIMLQMNSKKEN